MDLILLKLRIRNSIYINLETQSFFSLTNEKYQGSKSSILTSDVTYTGNIWKWYHCMTGDLVLGQTGRRLSSFYLDGSTGGTKWGQARELSSLFMSIAFWKGCLAPGDTSKEPVEACGMQVSSTNFKGLWELPDFSGQDVFCTRQ